MPIDPNIALGAVLPSVDFSWTPSDVQLYNLALGAGGRWTDAAELRYVDDRNPQVLPSFATVAPFFHETEPPQVKFPGVEIDLAKVVHGSQEILVHRPIPASGKAVFERRISEIWDKGSAAVIWQEHTATSSDGELLWTARSSIFAKGEGGFGGDRGPSAKTELPDRAPDFDVLTPTLPQQALLYRMCGDRNPCTRTPNSPVMPDSPTRSCTACAPTAWSSRPPPIRCSPRMPPASPDSAPDSPEFSTPARPSAPASGRPAANSSSPQQSSSATTPPSSPT